MANRQRGRPRKDGAFRRLLQVRLNDVQMEFIQRIARDRHLKPADAVRAVLDQAMAVPTPAATALPELGSALEAFAWERSKSSGNHYGLTSKNGVVAGVDHVSGRWRWWVRGKTGPAGKRSREFASGTCDSLEMAAADALRALDVAAAQKGARVLNHAGAPAGKTTGANTSAGNAVTRS